MISEIQKHLIIAIFGDCTFHYIHDKIGVEIDDIKSVYYDSYYYACERRALKDESLSVLIILLLDDHNTRRIPNSSW